MSAATPPPVPPELLARLEAAADRSVAPAATRHVLARLCHLEGLLVALAREREGLLDALTAAGWEAACGPPAEFLARRAAELERLRAQVRQARRERAAATTPVLRRTRRKEP